MAESQHQQDQEPTQQLPIVSSVDAETSSFPSQISSSQPTNSPVIAIPSSPATTGSSQLTPMKSPPGSFRVSDNLQPQTDITLHGIIKEVSDI